jgi:1-acyl-sn-glycerol-3-phosphate acyltransferase
MERKPMLRLILHTLAHFLFTLLSRMDVSVLENVPQSGGVILAANQVS